MNNNADMPCCHVEQVVAITPVSTQYVIYDVESQPISSGHPSWDNITMKFSRA
jgi:hypothetical protein